MLAVHSSSIVKIVKVNQITPKPGTFLVSRLDLLQSFSTEQNHLKITSEQVAPILRVSQVLLILLLLKAQNLAMVTRPSVTWHTLFPPTQSSSALPNTSSRSSFSGLLDICQIHLEHFYLRNSFFAIPSIWNSLPSKSTVQLYYLLAMF